MWRDESDADQGTAKSLFRAGDRVFVGVIVTSLLPLGGRTPVGPRIIIPVPSIVVQTRHNVVTDGAWETDHLR